MRIDSVEFVRSAAGARDLPDAGLPEFSMVGRSNVGKSSLINALVSRPVARTSATPGKTRLINVYRVVAASIGPFYLIDLPGYGYAKKEARAEFDRLASMYFARAAPDDTRGLHGRDPQRLSTGAQGAPSNVEGRGSGVGVPIGVLLALDARHPGMENDLATLRWLRERGFGLVAPLLVAVTKMDKLSRNERPRALDRFEKSCGMPVLAVSAATGEGLEDLWRQMTSWIASRAAGRRPLSRP